MLELHSTSVYYQQRGESDVLNFIKHYENKMEYSCKFTSIKVSPSRLECHAYFEDAGEFDIWFETDGEWILSDNTIALALCTLCGQKYDTIYFDLCLSEEISNKIELFTRANVSSESKDLKGVSAAINEGYVLSFSGGYDSLAAKYLMPENTKLIAVDFGKHFEREKEFFELFTPYIVRTNLRELKLDRNSWTFMGVGVILFSETLKYKYMGWGTILEATVYQMQKNPIAGRRFSYEPFASCIGGIQDIRIVNGLTEIGTAMIVLKQYQDMVEKSINSLAEEGTIKKYRKYLISDTINRKYNNNVDLKEISVPNRKLNWGEYFAEDFLALWEIKNCGIDAVSKIYYNIPERVIGFVENHQLNFYEKYNTNFLQAMPVSVRADYIKKLVVCHILPYSEFDWYEFDEVRKLLSEYHKINI